MFCVIIQSCNLDEERQQYKPKIANQVYTSPLQELSDIEYPDNPDIEIRHELSDQFSFEKLDIIKKEKGKFSLGIIPSKLNNQSDTILLDNIDLLEFIPSFPDWISNDSYLIKVGLQNQEWNRQQVKFDKNHFKIKGTNLASKSIVRVDIARNCLNSYLWEIIMFAANEDGTQKPCYHAWFEFPKHLYEVLFFQRNNIPFKLHQNYLEQWVALKEEKIDFDLLRTNTDAKIKILSIDNKNLKNLNNGYYPLVGERKKKYKNIVCPTVPKEINDFLNDSTLFSTFTPPGYYNTKDPRKTYLSKLAKLDSVIYTQTIAHNTAQDKTFELKFIYRSNKDNKITYLTLGGLKKEQIPILNIKEAKDGFQMPMGIANHSFYESYKFMLKNPSKQNPYYALLLNEEEKFIDSHEIGIDGPLLHWDQNNKDLLHVWILSFERHAFVGHYTLQL